MNNENVKPMGGWKMKLGSFLVAIGAVAVGSAEVAPYAAMIPWTKFIGFIIGGVGTAFVAWGAGHKLEKNRSVLVQKKTVPYYVHSMSNEEFEMLKNMREPKKSIRPPDSGIVGE